MRRPWHFVAFLFLALVLVLSACSSSEAPAQAQPTASVSASPTAPSAGPGAKTAQRPAKPGKKRPTPAGPPSGAKQQPPAGRLPAAGANQHPAGKPPAGPKQRPPAGKPPAQQGGNEAAASSQAQQRRPVAPPNSTPAPGTSSSTQIMTDSPLGVAFGPLQELQGRNVQSSLDGFMTYIHGLGIPRTKVSFYWSKLEPQPGQYDFHELDTYLDQLGPDDRALLNLFTDGWCTTSEEVNSRKGAPLRECPEGQTNCTKHCDEYYREFVTKVAEEVRDHAHGGIRYMQRDTEPASGRHFPADEPEAYVELQHIYYQAVKSVLPDMLVIGVNHNGNFSAHDMGEPLSADFFEYVLQHGKDDFDLLDIRLYGDMYAIQHRVEWFREHMKKYGYEKPIVSTEYGGVDPRTLHNGSTYVFQEQLKKIAADCRNQGGEPQPGCARKWAREHSEQVDPKLRPFFGIASDDEQAHYEQLHCYDIAQRSVMALSDGVQALWWWNLQSPGTDLIFGQMRLRTPDMQELPGYSCFQRFARLMGETASVKRIDVGNPEVYFFEVKKSDGSSMFVAWHREGKLDAYDAAAADPVNVSLPVPFSKAKVTDAMGDEKSMAVSGGKLKIALSNDPIFIEEGGQVSVPRPVVTPRPVPQPSPTPAPSARAQDLQVGLNFIRFYFEDDPHFQPDFIFRDFADLGAQAYRQFIKADLYWNIVEPQKGQWDFSKADAVIPNADFEPIVTLFANQFASPSPPWCNSPDEFQKTLGQDAIDYLEHVVDRYGPYVKYWEIGNEMGHWRAADPASDSKRGLPRCHPTDGFSPQEQGRFLAQAAAIIRQHDPDAVILLPGMGGISDYTLNDWLAGVIEGGGIDWFDIVNYHYYGPWQRYTKLRANLTRFLQDHGISDKPVWMTETGATSSATLTERTDYPNSPQTQAADVFRRLIQAWGSGDQLVLWHTYIGSEDKPNNSWREYGLRDADGSAKPALYSFRLLTKELVPFQSVTPVSADPRGLNVYRVETKSGAVKYVAWGSGSYAVPSGISRMTSVVPDSSGNFSWQNVTPGQTISLSGFPVLLK